MNRPGGGSSSKMPAPFFDSPPAQSPLGSAAIPPIPNPTAPVNETARMGQSTTERTPNRDARRDSRDHDYRGRENRGMNPIHNPVLRIIIESVLVFGLCLLIYIIVRGL